MKSPGEVYKALFPGRPSPQGSSCSGEGAGFSVIEDRSHEGAAEVESEGSGVGNAASS